MISIHDTGLPDEQSEKGLLFTFVDLDIIWITLLWPKRTFIDWGEVKQHLVCFHFVELKLQVQDRTSNAR